MNKENPVYKNIETIISHVRINMHAGDSWEESLQKVLRYYGDTQQLMEPGGIPEIEIAAVEESDVEQLEQSEVGMEKTFSDFEDYDECEESDLTEGLQELQAILDSDPEEEEVEVVEEKKKLTPNEVRDEILSEVHALPEKVKTEELEKFKDIYARATAGDGGLFALYQYLRYESRVLEDSEDQFSVESIERMSMDWISRIYSKKRDLHPNIRKRIEAYFLDIGPRPLPPIDSDLPKHIARRFGKSRWKAEEFNALCQKNSLLMQCVQFWCFESYKAVIEGVAHTEVEIGDSTKFEEDIFEWFDWKEFKESIERQPERRNEDKYAEQLFEKLRTTRYKATINLDGVDEKLTGLLERFPNFKDVISFIRTQVRLSAVRGSFRISPLLLEGPAGIGKTQFATELAQALGSTFTHVDISTTTESWVLSGLRNSWGGARAGKVAEALIASPNLSPVILLDELDKVTRPDIDPRRALYQLLEENTSSTFLDEFLDFQINASQVVFIASANSLSGITQPLLTRFKVFELQEPTPEERRVIIGNIYGSIAKSASVFETAIPEDVLESLLPYSFREAKNLISEAVGNVVMNYSIDELKNMKHQAFLKLEVSDLPLPRQERRSIGF